MIHCDLCGPMSVQTSSQKQYAAIFVDDFSRYVHLFLLRLKSDFFETFTYFANAIENETDSKLAFFKSDGDGIFSEKNDKFEAFLQSKGIQHIFSTPYCPSQNGRVERVIRTIVEMARTIMIHGDAPRSLWGEMCTIDYLMGGYRNNSLARWRLGEELPLMIPVETSECLFVLHTRKSTLI